MPRKPRTKVLAFIKGTGVAETRRAILISNDWIPKASVSKLTKAKDGQTVAVLKPKYARANPHLINDDIGPITRWAELHDGSIIFQGDAIQVIAEQPGVPDQDEIAELLLELEKAGRHWMDAKAILIARAMKAPTGVEG